MQSNSNTIKIRKTWGAVNPCSRPHSSKKGKRGYDRKTNKRLAQSALFE